MFKTHLVGILRVFSRRPGFTAINVAGLSVGFGCTLLIALFVLHDLSFDRFAPAADRTYRVVTSVRPPDAPSYLVNANGWPLGPRVAAEYPEVEALTSIYGPIPMDVKVDGSIVQPNVLYADEAFLGVLGFPLLAGDPATALTQPYAIVVTATFAQKIFGDTDPIGQTITLSTDSTLYTVTGLAADPPRTSHVQFEALASMATFEARNPGFDPSEQWFTLQVVNYLRLREGTNQDAFAEKLSTVYDRYFGIWNGYTLEAVLEPITGVYLHSSAGNLLGPLGNGEYVVLLSAIALLVLLIAAINYVNLSTARAAERAREVGVRKALGSPRATLVRKFLGESVGLTLAALLAGWCLALALLPLFNTLAERSFVASDLISPWVGVLMGSLVGIVGVGAGLYPAFVLSRYQPASILKGRFETGQQGVRIRQSLVVVQFALSIGLVVATLSVSRQLDFMQSRSLGFAHDEVLVVEMGSVPGSIRRSRADVLRQHLEGLAGVRAVSAAAAAPGYSGWSGQITFREGDEASGVSMEHVMADARYVRTLGLSVIAGRDFDPHLASDADGVLLNVEAVESLGWPSPAAALGQRVVAPGSSIEGPVIGVLDAYHQHGLRQPIPALAISQQNDFARTLLLVRVVSERMPDVEAEAARIWGDLFPGYPPQISPLDTRFSDQYAGERRLAHIFGVFALLAIALACLGLLGLTSYAAVQRRKEIGVRKVLGASVGSVVALLSVDLLRLVSVGFLVATPVAWWAMNHWLDRFAYRTTVGWDTLLWAALLSVAVTLGATGYHAFRAATADPTRALRSE